ncbi:MAG: two-component sensor histidine kinase [Leptolyngbyaceae cyanobacterium CSU_1_3]|nr:two-component sensor histidine kinase [Leptolyngbyaceae cyanobacterium CSU_1_3]
MFDRSRRNLAYWFALSMGSILIVFAGAGYSLAVKEQLRVFDAALYKKSQLIADSLVGNGSDPLPKEMPMWGDRLLINNDLVYVRLYDHKGHLVGFLKDSGQGRLETKPGYQTLQFWGYQNTLTSRVWLRQITIPVMQNKQRIAYLQVAASLTPLQHSLNEARFFLMLGVPTALGIIGVTGWFLGGLAMQPTRRAYEQLQRFTADASHELRAPVAAVLSNAQVGLMPPEDPQEQHQRLQNIVETAKSMSTLIGNLLFLSRNEGQLNPKTLKTIDIVALMQTLISGYTTQAATQNLIFTIQLPEQPIYLKADGELLRQAIVNLLNNAFKYTPPGGTVHLRVVAQSHRTIVQVEDSGIGIPSGDLPHVFERFYRVDTARSRQTGGFGLGLAIAQQIVQAHRGQITATSQVGKGSMFQLELPRGMKHEGVSSREG